jgi:hypothetical protein
MTRRPGGREDESGVEPLNPPTTLPALPEPRTPMLTLFRGLIRLQVRVWMEPRDPVFAALDRRPLDYPNVRRRALLPAAGSK